MWRRLLQFICALTTVETVYLKLPLAALHERYILSGHLWLPAGLTKHDLNVQEFQLHICDAKHFLLRNPHKCLQYFVVVSRATTRGWRVCNIAGRRRELTLLAPLECSFCNRNKTPESQTSRMYICLQLWLLLLL